MVIKKNCFPLTNMLLLDNAKINKWRTSCDRRKSILICLNFTSRTCSKRFTELEDAPTGNVVCALDRKIQSFATSKASSILKKKTSFSALIALSMVQRSQWHGLRILSKLCFLLSEIDLNWLPKTNAVRQESVRPIIYINLFRQIRHQCISRIIYLCQMLTAGAIFIS